MTISGKRALHHGDRIIGLGSKRIDFEITAHKRYDEKRKPVKKTKDGRRDLSQPPLRIKTNPRISDFQ